MTRFTVIIR